MLIIKKLFLLPFIVIIPLLGSAQSKPALKITYTGKTYNKASGTANGIIKCHRPDSLTQRNTPNSVLRLYVMNDARNIPMELMYRSAPLTPRALSTRKPTGDVIMFIAKANDIFRPDSANGYSWKWKGRAKCPKSPTDDYNGTPVKKLKCWYVLQAREKTYTSDTLTIEVTNATKGL